MSIERELLQKVVNHMWQGELVDEIKKLLAQPEQSSTTRHALDSYWNQEAYQRGYAEAELKLKREQEHVGIVRIIGGYPDNSERVVDWVRPYKYLKDGDRLYTAPPTREPLSEDEVRDGLDGKNGFENWYDDRFVDGVRFAEKHHGIGVEL